MQAIGKWSQIKQSKAVVDAKRASCSTRLGAKFMVAPAAAPIGRQLFSCAPPLRRQRQPGYPTPIIDRGDPKGFQASGGEADRFEAVALPRA